MVTRNSAVGLALTSVKSSATTSKVGVVPAMSVVSPVKSTVPVVGSMSLLIQPGMGVPAESFTVSLAEVNPEPGAGRPA